VIDTSLVSGVDIDSLDEENQRLLIKTILAHKHDIVLFLLERGADPILRNLNVFLLIVSATCDSATTVKHLSEPLVDGISILNAGEISGPR